MSLSPAPTRSRSVVGESRRLSDAWMALTGLSAVFLFEMLDNSVLNVALPTIGRDLGSSTTGLQWVSGAYSVAFGGLMLLFGAVADRVGRRRVMLTGLVLLAAASLATAAVTTTGQLVAVRIAMGVAAAMTTPGSMALAFRLFDEEALRVRALTVISTAGLVGLAVGPTIGGFVLAVAPWQVLLLADAPIAVLALVGIRLGVARDDRAGLRRDPVDVVGALLGTAAVASALVTPTVLVGSGGSSPWGWTGLAVAVACAAGFVARERTARHPLIDLHLLGRPMVSSGLAFKAASGLAVAGLSYLVTLQLQFAWGWPPVLAAVGTLPQVVVLLAGGRFVGPFVQRVGLGRAAWTSAAAVVSGLAVFGALSRSGYVWVLVALVLVAAGMRVVGVVAGASVLTGLPADRTSIGAALVDTSSELAAGAAVAAAGTIVAAFVTGSITTTSWTAARLGVFQDALTVAGLGLAVVAAVLVAVGMLRARTTEPHTTDTTAATTTTGSAATATATATDTDTDTEETPVRETTALPRPPFDPEFVPFLTAMDERGRFHLTAEMLPRMRALDVTEEQLDEGLHARGLERRSITVPGHRGDPITLAVVQRAGRTGAAACAYAIHGGGMVFGHHLGNLESYDEWLLAHDVVLVSPDYRLAPEHPDPYPVEDCYAGLVWVAEHGDDLGIDPERIVVVGQSAGAGLAAGTALLARDRSGPALIGQVLVSPMLDDRDATRSARQFDGVGVADREMTGFGWDAYLGDRRGGPDVSVYAAPARATDLTGLPPAYVDCGSAEVFRDETVAYAGALWAAGVQAELHVWPGAFHGSTSMLPDAVLSRRATRALRDFTGRLLGSTV